jgi:hypothetical protein
MICMCRSAQRLRHRRAHCRHWDRSFHCSHRRADIRACIPPERQRRCQRHPQSTRRRRLRASRIYLACRAMRQSPRTFRPASMYQRPEGPALPPAVRQPRSAAPAMNTRPRRTTQKQTEYVSKTFPRTFFQDFTPSDTRAKMFAPCSLPDLNAGWFLVVSVISCHFAATASAVSAAP